MVDGQNGAFGPQRTFGQHPREFREGLECRSPTCAVLHVSSLLRELVLEAVRLRELRASDALHRSLRDLIAAQLRSAPEVPISVRLPTDQRALRFSQNFISTLDNSTLLTEACRVAGVGIRTMERIFQKEVGMSLESWRRQVRLMKAVELLVEGCPVKKVAAEVGSRVGQQRERRAARPQVGEHLDGRRVDRQPAAEVGRPQLVHPRLVPRGAQVVGDLPQRRGGPVENVFEESFGDYLDRAYRRRPMEA